MIRLRPPFVAIFILLAIAGSTVFAGCGAVIRHTANRSYPPVSPERRQLGSIQAARKQVMELSDPNAYAFIPASDLTNYVQTAVADPIPLDAAAKTFLAGPARLQSPRLKLQTQEIALASDFSLELKGEHSGLDINGVKVAGRFDIRLYPELLLVPPASTVLRLRPAISSIEICDLDFSSTGQTTLYWLERRKLLSSILNSALKAFRDNLNGQLNLDVPVPIAPILVGREPGDNGNDGVVIRPEKLAAIQPIIAAGVVRVSGKGLMLVTKLKAAVLDPENLPKPEPPPAPPAEQIPPQATADEIDREFAKLDQAVEDLVKKSFGSYKEDGNVAAINKPLLASAFNDAFSPKQIEVGYSGPLEDQYPQKDDEKILRLPDRIDLHCDQLVNLSCDPRGTCTNFLMHRANDVLKVQRDICSKASQELQDALATIDRACSAVCAFGVCVALDPILCTAAKHNKEVAQAAFLGCSAEIDTATAFLNSPDTLGRSFAGHIGLGKFYEDVCAYYDQIFNVPECRALKATWDVSCGSVQATVDNFAAGKKIGELDWRVKGSGPDAIKGQASLSAITVSDGLDRVQIDNVQAKAQVTAEGWAKFDLEPAFSTICPPPPCTVIGGDCRINLSPTTFGIRSATSTIKGSFGISSFRDDDLNRDRDAFYIDPDSFDVSVTSNLAPIGKLLRDNALKLPCSSQGIVWDTYLVTDLISFTGLDLSFPHSFDVNKTRIAWADSTAVLPVSWTRDDQGNTAVLKTLKLPIRYSLTNSMVVLQADHIAAPQLPAPSEVFVSRPLIELTGGLSTAVVFASQQSGSVQTSDVFASAINPYISVAYRTPMVGAFLSYTPGPSVSDFGVGMGLAVRPFKKFDRLTFLPGVRLGQVSHPTESGPKFMLGVGVDLGRLSIRGCDKRPKG